MLSVSEMVPRMLPLAFACFLLAFQISNILGYQPPCLKPTKYTEITKICSRTQSETLFGSKTRKAPPFLALTGPEPCQYPVIPSLSWRHGAPNLQPML